MSSGAGFDPGRTRLRLAEVRSRKGVVQLTRFHSVDLEAGEDPHDVAGESFGGMRRKPAPTRVGLTGADLMLRYLPVPEVEDWRLERLMEFEVRELETRSGSPLATSYNLLPVPRELDDEDTILLGLVREDLLDEWIAALGSLPVQGFTPNAIALYNAYLALGDHEASTTLLANIGAGTLDLTLVRGTDLHFARSVTTPLEKRDATLAERLGTDAARARRLLHKHLDLGAAVGKRLDPDADRVTRPVLPLYDPLPTLLSSMVTLCKAQARLRDLALDRVLITGGGAATQGIEDFLCERLKVPVSVWNPIEMLDLSALPPEQAEQAEADGPGATVAIGLALSAADSELFALEILPKAARRKRDFRERGVFGVAAAVLAVGFLVADFVVTSGRTAELEQTSRRLKNEASAAETSHALAQDLLAQVEARELVSTDLSTRVALRRSAEEMTKLLATSLPDNLWVESLHVEMQPGDDWELTGTAVPVVRVTGHGENRARQASAAFGDFSSRVQAFLPGRERAMRPETKPKGRAAIEWFLTAHFLPVPPAADVDEDEG
ncbi:MAG TPA: pilus assembly protein PilM [Planctomycetota bacterium]